MIDDEVQHVRMTIGQHLAELRWRLLKAICWVMLALFVCLDIQEHLMVMVKVYKDLPGSRVFLDRAPGEDYSDAAVVIADELADAVNLVQNTKEYLACGALLGKIQVDPSGCQAAS